MFSYPELLVSRLIFLGLIVEAFEIFRLRRFFDENEVFSGAILVILTTVLLGPLRSVRRSAAAG
jgi:hypothetical protein